MPTVMRDALHDYSRAGVLFREIGKPFGRRGVAKALQSRSVVARDDVMEKGVGLVVGVEAIAAGIRAGDERLLPLVCGQAG